MYTKIKKSLRQVLPWEVLLKHEFYLRRIFAVLYIGKSVRCNICERQFSRFIITHHDDKMCPRCGSLSRHRRLWQIINHVITIHPTDRILDFSPSRMILKKLRHQYANYLSSDYLENKQVDRRYDITELPEPANSFDLIICYHVLEHIENDHKAINELYRVLKKDGRLLIQTPFKDGAIYENPAIVSKEERTIYFGQADHVRIYSVDGLKERLESAGFKVEIREYLEDTNNVNGFNAKEYILIGTR